MQAPEQVHFKKEMSTWCLVPAGGACPATLDEVSRQEPLFILTSVV
jgi:hypothetical protein